MATQEKNKKEAKRQAIAKLKRTCKRLVNANRDLQKNINRLKRVNKRAQQLADDLRSRYQENLERFNLVKEEIDDLFKISRAIGSSLNLDEVLTLITRFANRIIRTHACCLRLLNKKNEKLIPVARHCLRKSYIIKTPLKIGEGVAGKVAERGEPIAVSDLFRDRRVRYIKEVTQEGFKSGLSVPAIFNNKILGTITVYSKTKREFTEDEIKLLMTFANQAALAIHEAGVSRQIHIGYFNIIRALVLAVEAKDVYARGHSDRVTAYAIEIGRRLGLRRDELDTLRLSSQIHDVGKIAVSDSILNKPGRLNRAERAIIQLHPLKGAEMITPLRFLDSGIPIIRHHHERFDGHGYPHGLKDRQIPLSARIIACADAFDAMTSERPYRKRRLTVVEAIAEIEGNSGKQFDPQIARTFIQIIKQSSSL